MCNARWACLAAAITLILPEGILAKLTPFNFGPLASYSAADWTTILHSPRVRAESPTDDLFADVKFYSGYIPIGKDGSEMFYWYFPQADGNSTDSTPFIIWLTGGPGCSSEMAALTENGPLQIEDDVTVVRNPYSWNKLGDVVYIDQPLGTGFSVAKQQQDYVKGEEQVAADMHEFLRGFLQKFPELKQRPFYITGESYAGHYIPAVAHKLLKEPIDGLNFEGIAIGNGWVDPVRQYPAYAQYAKEHDMVGNIGYQLAKKGLDICVSLINRNMWELALVQCNSVVNGLLGKKNPYDVRLNCDSPPLCYNETALDTFMNLAEVQTALNVHRDWQECSSTVYAVLVGDWCVELTDKVAEVVRSGLRVLIYNGDQDFICNWMGGLEWVKAVQWKKQEEFNNQKFVSWRVNGKRAGALKQIDNFAFLRVFNAGHMVPMDQPEVAFEMIRQFVQEEQMIEHHRRRQPTPPPPSSADDDQHFNNGLEAKPLKIVEEGLDALRFFDTEILGDTFFAIDR